MRVVITGGGTGGHLSVAKAFLEEFNRREITCGFVGSTRGQDQLYFAKEEKFHQKWFLDSCGVVNQRGFSRVSALWQQGRALKKAFEILREFKPDFVLSVGGYSAAPAAFGAKLLGIPLIIHEQNARIGRLNKILKPFAMLFFSSYLENSPIKFYPVLEGVFRNARVRESVQTILFMGGSQGARAINNFALSMGTELKNRGIKVLCQSGKADFRRVVLEFLNDGLKVGILRENWELLKEMESEAVDSKAVLINGLPHSANAPFAMTEVGSSKTAFAMTEGKQDSKAGVESVKGVGSGQDAESLENRVQCVEIGEFSGVDVVVFGFSKSMAEIYALCDFAVCRAGASSLWELCANGLPALFVPYPYAAGNHQYYNAHFIEQKGLGFLCLEQDLFCNVLWDSLELLEGNISKISANLQKECAIDATAQMCDVILQHIK